MNLIQNNLSTRQIFIHAELYCIHGIVVLRGTMVEPDCYTPMYWILAHGALRWSPIVNLPMHRLVGPYPA